MSKNNNYFVHESSYIDNNVKIGDNTKIWHFSHIQSRSELGENCSIGQNVNVGNNVKIGNHVKIQNNVSIYEGVELEDFVFCGSSMVFTNIKLPRSEFPQRGREFYVKTLVKKICIYWRKCDYCLWRYDRRICNDWFRCRLNQGCPSLCPDCGESRSYSREGG